MGVVRLVVPYKDMMEGLLRPFFSHTNVYYIHIQSSFHTQIHVYENDLHLPSSFDTAH